MPWGDRTGPMGLGPMTGRASGYCAGYPVPGFMNPYGGSFAFGFGRGFRSWGMGAPWLYGAGYYPTGVPYSPAFPYYPTTPEQEIRILKNEAKNLEKELKDIRARIGELEREKVEEKSEGKV